MRDRTVLVLVLLLLVTAAVRADEDERKTKIEAQKKAAADAWLAVEAGPMASRETKHLLIYAPKSMEKRLEAIGTVLEKYHDQALAPLGLKADEAYPGKITVYLLPQRENLPAFARRVEKRRPAAGEMGSFSAADNLLHVAAIPVAGKSMPIEARAGEQLAALLAMRRAGVRTAVPDWVLQGFGRATSYRALPREKFVLEDRKLARTLVKKHKADDIWDGILEAEEAPCLQGSLVEMLSAGKRFGKLLDGFKPGENMATKTVAQAMEAADLVPSKVAAAWKKHVK
jgi:hypothetical protein